MTYPAIAERSRELQAPELERLHVGLGGFGSVRASPLLGGLDTATYRLWAGGPGGTVTELALRCYREGERGRGVERVRRDYAPLQAISTRLPFVLGQYWRIPTAGFWESH